jgi:hypothetical protein
MDLRTLVASSQPCRAFWVVAASSMDGAEKEIKRTTAAVETSTSMGWVISREAKDRDQRVEDIQKPLYHHASVANV